MSTLMSTLGQKMMENEDTFDEINRQLDCFFEDTTKLYEKAIELVKYRKALREKNYEKNTDIISNNDSDICIYD